MTTPADKGSDKLLKDKGTWGVVLTQREEFEQKAAMEEAAVRAQPTTGEDEEVTP